MEYLNIPRSRWLECHERVIWADILTLMEEQSLIQTIFDSENTGLELCYGKNWMT